MPSGSKWALRSFQSFVKKKREQLYAQVTQEDAQDEDSFVGETTRSDPPPLERMQNEDEDEFKWRLHEAQEQVRQRHIEEERIARLNAITIKSWRIKTMAYCFAYVALGLAFGATAPTLNQLAENTGSTTAEINSINAARGVGWIIGSMIGGQLTKSTKDIEYFGLLSFLLLFLAYLFPLSQTFGFSVLSTQSVEDT